MRVIAGEKGGRRLQAPPGRETRPTADRVREAAFSILESHVALDGVKVWDLFAGSGALGIEALSRGAAHATFIDHARTAISVTKANLARLGYDAARANVACADVLRWVHGVDPEDLSDMVTAKPVGEVDLVLADPPYAWQSWPALLEGLARLAPLVLMETAEEPQLPEAWDVVRAKRYGGTLVTLARLHATGDDLRGDDL